MTTKLSETVEAKPKKKAPTKKDILAKLEAELEVRQGLESTLSLQAEKIKKLLAENEQLAADHEEVSARLRHVLALLGSKDSASEVTARVVELQSWQELAQRRLAPTLESAEHQAEILWSYVTAMGSPGHRAVSFIGRKVGNTFVGRSLKNAVSWLIAIRRA